jgi:hypothetical protein
MTAYDPRGLRSSHLRIVRLTWVSTNPANTAPAARRGAQNKQIWRAPPWSARGR